MAKSWLVGRSWCWCGVYWVELKARYVKRAHLGNQVELHHAALHQVPRLLHHTAPRLAAELAPAWNTFKGGRNACKSVGERWEVDREQRLGVGGRGGGRQRQQEVRRTAGQPCWQLVAGDVLGQRPAQASLSDPSCRLISARGSICRFSSSVQWRSVPQGLSQPGEAAARAQNVELVAGKRRGRRGRGRHAPRPASKRAPCSSPALLTCRSL